MGHRGLFEAEDRGPQAAVRNLLRPQRFDLKDVVRAMADKEAEIAALKAGGETPWPAGRRSHGRRRTAMLSDARRRARGVKRGR